MKPFSTLFTFLLIAIASVSCEESEEPISQGRVTFALNVANEITAAARTSSVDFPAGTYLSITISNANGEDIQEQLDIYKMGERYVSDPLDLMAAEYHLTDFKIFSSDDEVIYATPKAASSLATLVSQPLPVYFRVTNNAMSNISADVVSTEGKLPEEFGYASFTVNVVAEPQFELSVFAPDRQDQLQLATAEALLISEGDTLIHTELAAAVNTMSFVASSSDICSLYIRKHGFAPFSRTFTVGELKEELNSKALKVVLEKALTFTSAPEDYGNGALFEFRIAPSTNANFNINWGDGTVESLSSDGFMYVPHSYPAAGEYFVSVTGDLDKIIEVGFYYSDAGTSTITLDHLPELTTFGMAYTKSPSVINVSNNTKLVSLDVSVSDVASLDISNNRSIQFLNVSGTYLNSEAIEKIIDDLTMHVIENNIVNGAFAFEADNSAGMVGPPVGDGYKSKLSVLINSYGWDVLPYPD